MSLQRRHTGLKLTLLLPSVKAADFLRPDAGDGCGQNAGCRRTDLTSVRNLPPLPFPLFISIPKRIFPSSTASISALFHPRLRVCQGDRRAPPHSWSARMCGRSRSCRHSPKPPAERRAALAAKDSTPICCQNQ